jgi:hypothetical protein
MPEPTAEQVLRSLQRAKRRLRKRANQRCASFTQPLPKGVNLNEDRDSKNLKEGH